VTVGPWANIAVGGDTEALLTAALENIGISADILFSLIDAHVAEPAHRATQTCGHYVFIASLWLLLMIKSVDLGPVQQWTST
jgi:hypothetical protein